MSKESDIRRILTAMGQIRDEELTPEQEQLLKQALYPEEQFYADVLHLFSDKEE